MAKAYQLKFYQPDRRLEAADSHNAIQALLDRGGTVLSYTRGSKFQCVPSTGAIQPGEVVEPDGSCSLSLLFERLAAAWPVTFQVHAPKEKGDQAGLSLEADLLEKDPDRSAWFMLNLASPLAQALGAKFAWIDHEELLRKLEKKLTFDGVQALAWANLFSQPLVHRLGDERLKSTPAYNLITTIHDVLLLTAASPVEKTSSDLAALIAAHWPGCRVREIDDGATTPSIDN